MRERKSVERERERVESEMERKRVECRERERDRSNFYLYHNLQPAVSNVALLVFLPL